MPCHAELESRRKRIRVDVDGAVEAEAKGHTRGVWVLFLRQDLPHVVPLGTPCVMVMVVSNVDADPWSAELVDDDYASVLHLVSGINVCPDEGLSQHGKHNRMLRWRPHIHDRVGIDGDHPEAEL